MEQLSIRKYAFACLSLLLLVFSSQLSANQQAINWLETQYEADGSYGISSNISTPFQSTSEIVSTYHLISYPKNMLSSVQYLDADTYESCEYLSRKITARINSGQNAADLIAKLTLLQNTDGGFGEMAGYDSTSIDTALALYALAVANLQNSAVIRNAISYLVQQQQSDGGYPLKLPNVSAVYNTALVTIALQKYGYAYSLDSNISRALSFISTQRVPGGAWQSHWETAVALHAIATVTPDLTNYALAIEQFRASQLANGSWDNDVYVTALAIKADYILNQRQLPVVDNAGGLTGKIIDAISGAPLQGVNVRLDAAPTAVATAADGLFSMSSVTPGQHTVSLEYAGYLTISRNVTIQTGVWSDIGTNQLSPLNDQAVISGTVRDAATGVPVSGAMITVTGVSSLTAVSNANGFYQIVFNPGSVNVSVTATGYESVSGSGVVAAGSVVNFSPSMYAAGAAPVTQTVTVKGQVVDADSGVSISGAGISINNVHMLDAASGSFQIDNIDAGMISIDISHDGYQLIRYTVLAPQGSVLDLGLIRLQKSNIALSTVTGHVVDDEYNTPVAGVEIRVLSMPGAVVTDANGDFLIQNVAGSSFSVTANAAGYLSSVANVNVASPGAVNVSFRLKRTTTSGFDILEAHTHLQQFPAMTEVEVDAIFSNTGTSDRSIVPYIKVLNSSNEVVEKTLSKTAPIWPTLEQIQVIVPPGAPLETEMEWNSDRYAPGVYTLVIQAYDAQSSVLLAERSTQIEILPTHKIGGLGVFDPPLAQLAANKPVQLKSTITNQGNSPIAETTVTARVRLKNKGFTPAINPVDISIVANQNGIQYPQGLAMDTAGNIYVANGVLTGSVSRITPDGIVSTFVSNVGSPVDVDTDSAGNVYVLLQNSSFLRVTPDGQRTTVTTGLTQQKAIKVLDDGRILIAVGRALYEVMPGGAVHLIVSNGLSNAQGIAVDSLGQLFIANRSDNNVVRYSNGVLSSFVSGINQPYGIAIDGQDNIYVTSYGDNTLLRITPDKQVTTIATGLSGPYDVKLADGNFIVSNNLSNEIVSVTPQGYITVLVAATINRPVTASYANSGDLYVGNSSSANVVRLDAALQPSVYSQSTGVRQLKQGRNGGLNVLDNSGLRHIGDNHAESLVTSRKYTAFDELLSGDGYLGVYQGNIEQISSSGQSSPFMQSLIASPQTMHRAADGSFYIVSTNGIVLKVDINGNYAIIAQNLGSSLYGVTEDASGNVYVTNRTARQIIRIDTAGVVSVFATTSFAPGAITINDQGEFLVAQYTSRNVYRIANGVEMLYTTFPFNVDYDLYVDSIGNVWASHFTSGRVTRRDSGGVFTSYTVSYPRNFFETSSGAMLVSAQASVVQITPAGTVSTILTHPVLAGTHVPGVGVAPDGRMLVLISNGVLHRFAADRTLEASFASIYTPEDLMIADDGALFVINQNGQILKIVQPNRLPSLLATGTNNTIVRESHDTALLASASSVSRLNLLTNQINPVVTGFSSIGALAVNPNGGFVVGDIQRNDLSFYNAQDVLMSQFVGLVQPKGILIGSNGELFVANSMPNKICKMRPDGKLDAFSLTAASSEYIAFNNAGNILATRSGVVAEIDGRTGSQLGNIPLAGSNRGIAVNASGHSFINNDSKLYQIVNAEPALLASGLTDVSDLDTNSLGNIFVTDATTGTVSQVGMDGSISLILRDLPTANNLAFGSDDTVYVQYNVNHLMSFRADTGRVEHKIAGVIRNALGGLLFANNSLLASIPETSTVARLFSVGPKVEFIPGEQVYVVTRPLPAIPMSDMKVDIDFGEWLPENSGDYEMDVSLDDGLTEGHLVNSLHVGPMADGELSLAASVVFPGDQVVTGHLNIRGADSTSITNINPGGIAYAASSGATTSRAVAADTYGNIYVADTASIKRMAPDGTITTFVTGLAVGTGMAADSSNNLYAVGDTNGNVYKITPDAQYSVLAVLPTNAAAVATDYNDVVYAIDQQNLYRIDQNGSIHIIRDIQLGSGLTIDAFGNFYITTGTTNPWKGNEIVRISPDGLRSAMYFDDASFEFEGVNVTADCSNNLLFAPWQLFSQSEPGNEEDKIVQLVGETGVVRDVLYGPSIDVALADMDILYYDRFSQRLIIWTDRNDGRVFSFPVVCGGLDLEAHIVTRSDVDLSSTNPSPTSIHDRADGTREFVWLLSQVDNSGQNIQLNMLFKGLNEAETRGAFTEAFLLFNNSFDSANPVKVALDIPDITASSSVDIQPVLNATQYPANSDVNISVAVNNRAGVVFGGTLDLDILDTSGVTVASLPAVNVTAVPANDSVVYSAQWNTGNTYAGNYVLHAKLTSNTGFDAAEAEVNFAITATAAGNSVITTSLNTDKPVYQSWDVVNIDARVRNDSSNVVQLPTTAVLSVSTPEQILIFSETYAIGELYSRSYQDIPQLFNLVDAQGGDYIVTFAVNDAATGVNLSSSTTQFSVSKSSSQSVTGTIKATPRQLIAGETASCESTTSNISAADIDQLTIVEQIIDMAASVVVSEQRTAVTLSANSQTSSVLHVGAANLPASEYACVLSAELNGDNKQLAADGFRVNASQTNIHVNVNIVDGVRGRLLVLMDEHKDPNPDGSPAVVPILAQQQFIDAYLTQHNWAHTIVNTAQAFLNELRHGGYSGYILFSENIPLDDEITKEIREAVNNGDGLLVAGKHFELNGYLDVTLGIKYLGRETHSGLITFSDSPLALTGDQMLSFSDMIERTMSEGSVAAGIYYPTDTATRYEPDAAVTYFEYGLGRSVYVAFDLLSHVTAMQQDNLLDDLITTAVQYTHPAPLRYEVGKTVPVTVIVNNTGDATSGRVLVTVPAGVTVINSGGAIPDVNNAMAWLFNLPASTAAQFTFMIQLPETPDQVSVHVVTQTGTTPDWVEQNAVDFIISPEMPADIMSVVDHAAVYIDADEHIKTAYDYYLLSARAHYLNNEPDKMMPYLMAAVDEIIKSQHQQAPILRLELDDVIAITARKLAVP